MPDWCPTRGCSQQRPESQKALWHTKFSCTSAHRRKFGSSY